MQAAGARFSLNTLSAVNAQGPFRFMSVEGGVNATVFREFLNRLITGMLRKVFLIVDGYPVHKASWYKNSCRKTAMPSIYFSCRPTRPSSIPMKRLRHT